MRAPSTHNLTIAAAALLLALAASAAHGQVFQWRKGALKAAPKAATGTPAAQTAAIREMVEKQQYPEAIKAAKALVKAHPTDAACEEAMLLAGESELARERYYQAFEWFDLQAIRFPSGKLLGRALDREYIAAEALLSGKKRRAWGGMLRLSAKQEGLDILAKITEHAPGTRIARKALLRICDYHFDAGQWVEATDSYDTYVKLYKNDSETPYAMLQACRAARSQFSGVDYDDTPLLEAQQRYTALAERFPQAAREANVAQTLREIHDARAKKLFLSGDFYKRTGRSTAAAYYYQQVIRNYADTPWADRARQGMNLLGDVPPQAPGGAVAVTPARIRTTPAAPAVTRRKPATTQPEKPDNRFLPPGPPSEEGMVPTTEAGKVKEPR